MNRTARMLAGFLVGIAACPALAQPYGAPSPSYGSQSGWGDIGHRIDWTQHDIDNALAHNALDHREYEIVESKLKNIHREWDKIRALGKVDSFRVSQLEGELDSLHDHIKWARSWESRRPW